jgi:hypothetical protein
MDEVALGEVVFEDSTGTFRVVYGGVQKIEKHGFVTYMLYRSHWKRINRTPTYKLAMDCIRDFKERLGVYDETRTDQARNRLADGQE